jgi:hypothetical protein
MCAVAERGRVVDIARRARRPATDVVRHEKTETCKEGPKKEHTPPDFGIFTTVIRLPYVRCISTFSFSCPTTRITLTEDSGERPSSKGVVGIESLLRNASTHALISVCRWSGVEALEGDEAKLDGVSTMIPETRPR